MIWRSLFLECAGLQLARHALGFLRERLNWDRSRGQRGGQVAQVNKENKVEFAWCRSFKIKG